MSSRQPSYTKPEIYFTPSNHDDDHHNTGSTSVNPETTTNVNQTRNPLMTETPSAGRQHQRKGSALVATAVAGGSAFVVTSTRGVGKVARKCGGAVADAGVGLKRFNQRHQITKTTSTQVTKSCNWAVHQFKKPKQQPTSFSTE
jgi:hypothetical protein